MPSRSIALLLLAAEAGEKLTEDEQRRLYAELIRASKYAKRLLAVTK